MAAFLDLCRFIPTAGGTADWTFAGVVGGCQSPARAGAVNGTRYKVYAVSADLTQWELAEGAYTASTGSFARTIVLSNSDGTGTAAGQSGAGARISFTAVPNVAIVGVKEDLISVEEANAFTSTQQTQARGNIAAAASPAAWTRTTLTSGSGSYVTKAGCKALLVRLIGGGGGGAGQGTNGGAGAATSFGAVTAGGGGFGGAGGSPAGTPGTSSGGDININGSYGYSGPSVGGAVFLPQSPPGVPGPFGGGGQGGWVGGLGQPGQANSGSGGGGCGCTGTASGGMAGGAGGYCEKLFASPAASYTYTVGAGGAAGPGNGSAGGSGLIIVDEYY